MIKITYIVRILFVCAIVAGFSTDVDGQDKQLGRHTVSEWRAIIDTTWGPGLPTATKLQVFDAFWSYIDKNYAGFPNLDIDWDALRGRYRPEVATGVSRGRFAAIAGKLSLLLQEIHTGFVDVGIDNAGYYSTSDAYIPRRPVFWSSGWGPCGIFGAALTPLPDSSLVVYKVIDAHPLGLKLGDIILGYDRIPWKSLYRDLLEVEFPIGVWSEGRFGSSPRSMTHSLLCSAGNNWGFFDTIDVVKYATGDTLHLATDPLAVFTWDTFFSTEQLPVPGVRMPNFWPGGRLRFPADLRNVEAVSSGIVEGTSIGYIYVYQWDVPTTEVPFYAAVNDLVTVKKVSGLILDFRYNLGSGYGRTGADRGFDCLFNENPGGPSRWQNAMRNPGGDHLSFAYGPPFDGSITMNPDYYDHPIAVLTGPQAWSFGDLNPFRMRSHPMVRFFGLPTNGSFPAVASMMGNPPMGPYGFFTVGGQMVSSLNGEGFLMHKGFPVDEEVWLTRDGVAKGEDDVVKRALEWITTLTHAHDIALDRYHGKPGKDSLSVTAILNNPLSREARVSAIVGDGPVVHDSVLLYNDGLHGDGAPGDSLWGARILMPAVEGTFGIHLQTNDLSEGTSRRLGNAAFFTTAGPLVLDSLEYLDHRSDGYCELLPYVKNNGPSAPFKSPTISISCTDSGVISAVPVTCSFYTIAAGAALPSIGAFIINYDPDQIAHDAKNRCIYLNLTFALGLSGHACWDTTFRLAVSDPPVGVAEEEAVLPTTYALEQNYPNPFNPRTEVRSQTPEASNVRIVIYDVLGREVKVLVNERRPAGYYQDAFDASGLASGLYIYRLTAGRFVQSRKMMLLK